MRRKTDSKGQKKEELNFQRPVRKGDKQNFSCDHLSLIAVCLLLTYKHENCKLIVAFLASYLFPWILLGSDLVWFCRILILVVSHCVCSHGMEQVHRRQKQAMQEHYKRGTDTRLHSIGQNKAHDQFQI